MLDGLRGIAILCVLLEHFGGTLAVPFDFGYYGVDLFFVLSGYLITDILLKMPNDGLWVNLRTFVARRTFRIFPMYYLTIATLFFFNIDSTQNHILPLASYAWNYFCFDGGPFYLWSLSVEEQFYLVWPLLALTLRRHPKVLTLITISLILLSYCQIVFNIVPSLSPYNYTGLPNRMGSLCLGGLGAILSLPKILPNYIQKSKTVEIIILVSILWSMATLRNFIPRSPISGYAIPIASLASLFLICKCVQSSFAFVSIGRFLENRSLCFLGTVSYGVYLIHFPMGNYFRSEIFGPIWHRLPFEELGPFSKLRWHSWILSFPMVVLLSVGLAAVSWFFIEKPILEWNNRRIPSKRTTSEEDKKGASGVPN